MGHRWDEDKINQLTDEQESSSEEPEEPGDPLAVVETVDTKEPDKAQAPE
jgi:hypothetical protein